MGRVMEQWPQMFKVLTLIREFIPAVISDSIRLIGIS